jgi:hypothetical protein
MTTTTIPLPPGAIKASEWQVNGDNVFRIFDGPTRQVGRTSITMIGVQEYSGAVRSAGMLVEEHTGASSQAAVVEVSHDELGALLADVTATLAELDSLSAPGVPITLAS